MREFNLEEFMAESKRGYEKLQLKITAFHRFHNNLISFIVFIPLEFFAIVLISVEGLDWLNILLIFITFLAFAAQTLITIYFLREFNKYE